MSKNAKNGKTSSRKAAKSPARKATAKRSSSRAAARRTPQGTRASEVLSGPASEALEKLSYFYT